MELNLSGCLSPRSAGPGELSSSPGLSSSAGASGALQLQAKMHAFVLVCVSWILQVKRFLKTAAPVLWNWRLLVFPALLCFADWSCQAPSAHRVTRYEIRKTGLFEAPRWIAKLHYFHKYFCLVKQRGWAETGGSFVLGHGPRRWAVLAALHRDKPLDVTRCQLLPTSEPAVPGAQGK